MNLKSFFAVFTLATLLCSCGENKSKLAQIAAVYTQINENQEKYAEGYRSLYEMPKEQQEDELNKLNAQNEKWTAENISLAEKAEKLADELLGTEFPCTAEENTGITVKSAKFTVANAKVNNYNGMGGCVANFVVTVEYQGSLKGKPYFELLAGNEAVCRSLGSVREDGTLSFNFRIHLMNAKELVAVDAMRIVGGGSVAENAESTKPEPTYEGNDVSDDVQSAGELKVGGNLADALRSAKGVTYEYNADSGIWATIGNVAIVIEEDQLNQKGIDFLSTIYSDIAPDIAFKPEYVKADAKILRIEKQ
ncbi:MAG: hypothetical protein PUB84_01380 [Bacteroidales bacterium]|nr:hypothetical protein [Bacteroidales bacterium]MDD6501193.1 hypothetical protein [Bacteroidales bacterium]MDD6538340.1 hypothetical protein [Bacteroidales bacterium]